MKDGVHIHRHKKTRKQPTGWVKGLDLVVAAVGFIAPLMTLPQIYAVWVGKETAGIAIATWIGYFVVTIPLLMYSLVHKIKPLIKMYSLWLIVHASMILGVLIYS